MGNEDGTGDQEDKEIVRRKEGSGQIPSGTNPRGAGRPTKDWLRFKREQKEYQAWEEATARGEFVSSATVTERFLDTISGRGEGDSVEQHKGFVERTLKRLKLDKVFGDLKFDKVEQLLYKGGAYFAPYVLPVLGGAVAVYVGATGLYIVEEIDKTDTYTKAEWDALDLKVQRSYHTINGRKLTKEERLILITPAGMSWMQTFVDMIIDPVTGIEVETEIVKATRKMFPQIIHSVMEFQEWFTGTVEKIQVFFEVDDFPLFKMQNMFYYHVRKYFKRLSSLFENVFDK